MKVVIFAGGLGTRLKEETEFRPKPMILVGGRPIIWHIMKNYSHYGFNEFIIAGGYKVQYIKEYFLNFMSMINDITIDFEKDKVHYHSYNHDPFKVSIIDTGLQTMTGGRLRRLKSIIGNERFMATYGDGVSNINVAELLEYHKSHKKIATVTGVHPSTRFGHMNIRENLVINFQEKPEKTDHYINGGYFVFEPEIFDYIEGDHIALEREPLETLTKEGHLAIYKHEGFWRCMDTYKDMEVLNELWSSGKAEWKIWNDKC